MLLAAETLGLCLFFWLMCFLGTGTDEKNLRSYESYPDAVQKMLREDKNLGKKIRTVSKTKKFLSNVILFSLILFFLGIPLRGQTYSENFLIILIMGQCLNAFDLLVIDLSWFRHTRRTRFQGTEDRDDLYRDPKNHTAACIRGVGAFFLTAVLDGFLLTLF